MDHQPAPFGLIANPVFVALRNGKPYAMTGRPGEWATLADRTIAGWREQGLEVREMDDAEGHRLFKEIWA